MSKTVDKAINMNIDAEVWRKVGLIAVVEDSTKKAIVEAAITEYAKKYGDRLAIQNK